ncbi:MAG: hypothetical protein AVDCRST_MAG51-2992, partial [uncultured Ramlibacter sp.]
EPFEPRFWRPSAGTHLPARAAAASGQPAAAARPPDSGDPAQRRALPPAGDPHRQAHPHQV